MRYTHSVFTHNKHDVGGNVLSEDRFLFKFTEGDMINSRRHGFPFSTYYLHRVLSVLKSYLNLSCHAKILWCLFSDTKAMEILDMRYTLRETLDKIELKALILSTEVEYETKDHDYHKWMVEGGLLIRTITAPLREPYEQVPEISAFHFSENPSVEELRKEAEHLA